MTMGWAGTGCSWGNYGAQPGFGTGFGSQTTFGGGFFAQPSSPITTSGYGGGYGGFTPYVKAFESGWNGAIQRMLAEARALGAEGVVGVKIERTRLENQTWEFTALGTAVRSMNPMLAPRPTAAGEVWSTNLSAEDTASAILSGFMPHEIVLGISVSTKHEDWQLAQQRNGWINQEVEGMSELIRAARNEARARVVAHATHVGGAELVVTGMDLYEFETRCGQDGRDFHAEASVIGTTLIPVPQFRGRPEASRVLTVIPLKDL
jgi:uncharacterized protein YbjQ (UPF0145 family)